METLTVPLSSIDEGRRFRKEYKNIEALEETIAKYGVIQPLAVAKKSALKDAPELSDALDEKKPYLLLAGGRRFRAVTNRKLAEVPVRIYDEPLDAFEAREIELLENSQRENLAWQEEVNITAEIHRLRELKFGPSVGARAEGGATKADTAKLLNKSASTVTRELQLATSIGKVPGLENAKTKEEANKILRKHKEDILMAEMAKRHNAKVATQTVQTTKDKLIKSYVLGNFFERAKDIATGSIDLVEFDPPYAGNMGINKKSRPNLAGFKDWTPEEFEENVGAMLKIAWRIMKPNAWGWMWYFLEPYHGLLTKLIREQGFETNGTPYIWGKTDGHGENVNYNLISAWEPMLYFRKGSPVLRQQGFKNFGVYPPVRGNSRTHRTQKSLLLYESLLKAFVAPGSTCVSPFLGSGTFLLAAHNVGVNAFGYDNAEDDRNRFIQRVQSSKSDKRFE